MATDERATEYQRGKKRCYFVNLFLDIIVLLVFFFGGFSVFLREFSYQYFFNLFVINSVYLLIFASLFYVLHFPLSYFLGFTWEHKFNLSTQTFAQWMKDDVKKNILGFFIIFILVHVVYFLIGRFPLKWWIGVGFFWLFLSIVLAKLMPNVIIPLFYKYSPIENSDLKDQIKGMFASRRIGLKDIYSLNLSSKTKKANAFLCGVGKNRRVVLSDTLLANFSNDEIEVVVAHELAHYVHKDIIKLLLMNTVAIFCGLYLVDKFLKAMLTRYSGYYLDDIAFLPIMALTFIVFGFFVTPLLNAYNRWIEKNADKFCLKTTDKPNDFISLMEKLRRMNLSELKPGRLTEMLFYDHPPIYKRVEMAQQYIKNE